MNLFAPTFVLTSLVCKGNCSETQFEMAKITESYDKETVKITQVKSQSLGLEATWPR